MTYVRYMCVIYNLRHIWIHIDDKDISTCSNIVIYKWSLLDSIYYVRVCVCTYKTKSRRVPKLFLMCLYLTISEWQKIAYIFIEQVSFTFTVSEVISSSGRRVKCHSAYKAPSLTNIANEIFSIILTLHFNSMKA